MCRVKTNQLTRFVINRLFPDTTLGSEVKEALSSFGVPMLENAIRNRTEYAKAARTGMTALETEPNGQTAQEVNAVVKEISKILNQARTNAHGRS